MSVKAAHTYLLSLPKNQTEVFWQELLSNAVPFEILDPIELGEEWMQLEKLTPTQKSDQDVTDAGLLDQVIASYSPKGLLSSIVDNRHGAKISDLSLSLDEQNKYLEIARKLKFYKQNRDNLEAIQKHQAKNQQKEFLVGANMASFSSFFQTTLQNEIETFKVSHPETDIDLEMPELEFIKINELELLQFDSKDQESIQSVLQEYRILHPEENYLSLPEFFKEVESETEANTVYFQQHEVDPDKPSKHILKNLSITHAIIQLKSEVRNLEANQFVVSDKPSAIFAFCSVPPSAVHKFKEVVAKHDIVLEDFEWNKEIVIWHQPGGLGAFQQIIQALGTIGRKESDPTGAVSFFFILFFAMAINDALYGLILVVICGYFKYFAKAKPGFKGIVDLFFLAGIGSVGYGALTNSWGGNLLEHTPLNGFLHMFQVISPLEPENDSPVNSILRANGGLSPIVAMLGFAVVIGLLHIFTAYILKIQTALKHKDGVEAMSEVSWMSFLIFIALNIYFGLSLPSFTILGYAGIIVSVIGIFVFNHGKGVAGKLLSGAVKIYEIVAFFADMLSYTRLIAIGLTGAIIAEVINLLGNLVYTSSGPVLGLILGGIVLLVGHLFNLVVALFGSYINPLRLHYVEFLPKFFKGEGRSLKPWSLDFTHLKINQ